MKETTGVLICGVGGQGVLLASEVLSQAALRAGMDVKKSEVHGMSQRGGSVESHARFGDTVNSPLIKKRSARALLAFEPMEALRYADYLADDGIAIISTHRVIPALTKEEDYPQDIAEKLAKVCKKVYEVPTDAITAELGNPKVVNTVLLGVLSNFVGLDENVWQDAVASRVPKKVLELNRIAFERGRNWVAENN